LYFPSKQQTRGRVKEREKEKKKKKKENGRKDEQER
jgi:hypothetical protein